MGLFRNRQPVVPAPQPRTSRPRTTFLGIAARSFEAAGDAHPVPYELETDGGVPVRLHDMSFLGFDYRVDPPTLTMRFVYDDPEWTPPQALHAPVAVYRFDGVQVRQWEDDEDLFETPSHARGQVSDLSYDEQTSLFALQTLNTRLLFSADRLTVTTGPRSRE